MNFPPELRCRNFVDKHWLSTQNRCQACKKRARNVRTFRLSFHIACHHLVVGVVLFVLLPCHHHHSFRHLLTAAHCLVDWLNPRCSPRDRPGDIEITAGVYDPTDIVEVSRQSRVAEHWIPHPKFCRPPEGPSTGQGPRVDWGGCATPPPTRRDFSKLTNVTNSASNA